MSVSSRLVKNGKYLAFVNLKKLIYILLQSPFPTEFMVLVPIQYIEISVNYGRIIKYV